jgi:Zn-finger nucleic acid-binding protein
VDLVLADRQGIEIDYCPQCRGIWLDRGELDKIIERNAACERRSPDANRTSLHRARAGPCRAMPSPRRGGREVTMAKAITGVGTMGGHHGGYQRGGFLGGLFRH